MAQVLAVLVKPKELSIIHANLKPENIMLVDHMRYPSRVKLINFGSTSILTEVCHVKEPYIQTRFYRAPETLLGLPFCEKVDVRSLGCMMAELQLRLATDEYDQVRYIRSTLGLPRCESLCAAGKTWSFFRRRRWLSTVKMVEVVKKMLTRDSHERLTASATLKHPFVSSRQLNHRLIKSLRPPRYYQLRQEDSRASRKYAGAVETFPGTEEGAFIPTSQRSTQKAFAQLDGLSQVGTPVTKASRTSAKLPSPPTTAPSTASVIGVPRWSTLPETRSRRHLPAEGSSAATATAAWAFGGMVEQNLPGDGVAGTGSRSDSPKKLFANC
nr:PREDICTED: homeodomain-interacting protein kinase 4 [Pelecanus crispus]